METKAYNYESREAARKALGFSRVEAWSDHVYAGKHSRRLVFFDSPEVWFNEAFEDPKTGHVIVYRPAMAGRPERGKAVLRRALRAAILSAGAWAEKFDGYTSIYPPHIPAGIKALERQGRRDLIPALRRRCASGRYDVTSLAGAKALIS